MQQLNVEAFSLPCICQDEVEVEARAHQLARLCQLPLKGKSLGADVWFAVMPHPQGAIQLHYDFPAECFWLTPTGQLTQDSRLWFELKQRLALLCW